MREIKFRAAIFSFSNETKKYEFEKITYEPYGYGWSDGWDDNFFDLNMWLKTPMVDTRNIYVLQQYTGFKDRTGKEIYEGDIITNNQSRTDVKYAEVVFEEGSFIVTSRIKNYHKPRLQTECCKMYTVVSNIFENKELLNANKETEYK